MPAPSDSLVPPAKKDLKDTSTATQLTREWLEQQTREFLDAFNRRDFDFLEGQYSSIIDLERFVGTIGNHAPTLSWKDHIDVYRHMADSMPGLHIKPMQVDFDIKEDEGTAELFVFAEVTGQGTGIKTQGLSNLSWRQKRGGQWLCIRHTILQAMGDVV